MLCHTVGWSNFSDEATARNFAAQCLDCCERFGLVGIDIDDEYSQPDLHLPKYVVRLALDCVAISCDSC